MISGLEVLGSARELRVYGRGHMGVSEIRGTLFGVDIWEFPKLGVPYLGFPFIRILPFRVLY